MSMPDVVSRDAWEAARQKLLLKEKEMTRARDALNAERRRLPMVRIEQDYVFEHADGKANLLALFDGRRQLIVYHMMWVKCPGCSLLVDNIGHLAHLHARDTTLVVVSRAPWQALKAFKDRMGWTSRPHAVGSAGGLGRASRPLEYISERVVGTARRVLMRAVSDGFAGMQPWHRGRERRFRVSSGARRCQATD
jgi:hypothetical protein